MGRENEPVILFEELSVYCCSFDTLHYLETDLSHLFVVVVPEVQVVWWVDFILTAVGTWKKQQADRLISTIAAVKLWVVGNGGNT